MNRKQLFSMMMAAGLLVAASSINAFAGLVKIKLIGEGGSVQQLTLFVAENCARTSWPPFVTDCQDVDPDYTQPQATQFYVMAPNGRLFKLALGFTNADMAPERSASEWVNPGGHPRDDIGELGATIGGGSQILVHRDEDGKVDRSLVRFTRLASWDRFRNGDDSAEMTASWGGIKSTYE